MKNFKFHYNTIGDCFYDIYCQPNCTKKEEKIGISQWDELQNSNEGGFVIDDVWEDE